MTSGDSNSSSRSHSGSIPDALVAIPEEQLLAWIEGEVSPAEAAALATSYSLATPLVGAMRRDRATLAAAATAKAPADLADRVMAAIEREALLGLSEGALVSDSLPISQVPRRTSIGRLAGQLWWQRATPRLALAAGITLIASAGMILVMRSGATKQGATDNGGLIGPLAISDANAGVATRDGPTINLRGVAGESGVNEGNNAAEATGTGPFSKIAAVLGEGAIDSDLDRAASKATTLNPERALALANEGRLVLRVRGVSTPAVARLAGARDRVAGIWRVQGEVPPSTLAALNPQASPAPIGVSGFPELSNPIVASSFSGAKDRSPDPDWISPHASNVPTMDVGPLPPASLGSMIDARADAQAIEAAREQLSKLLGREVEFEEAPRPILIDAPAATPESVLWWTRPPQTWAHRVRVPMVVELE